jgi:hypothetical protein
MKIFFFTAILSQLLSINVFGQSENTIAKKAGAAYFENKGQLIDQYGASNPAVKFLFNGRGMNVQLRASGFSYDCYSIESHGKNFSPDKAPNKETKDSSVYHFNRIDVTLVNANLNSSIVSSNPSKDYTNYYNENSENGFLGIHSYSYVIYKNIYQNIDLEFYVGPEGNCKYQFLVHPGGDPNEIKLSYSGTDTNYIFHDQLILKFGNDSLVEKIPVSYILENGKKIPVRFLMLGNGAFGFDVPENNIAGTLIIDPDPALQWSTYYGGNDFDQTFSVTARGDYTYGAGQAASTNNIATSGAHQVTLVQWHDGFICKLDATGNRLWGTYYGGTGEDACFGITTDPQFIYVTGYSEAPTGMSSVGSFQPASGGLADGMILKFDTAGARVWGTYYGGSGFDLLYGIICKGPFLYITGHSESSVVFATSGCHQPVYAGNEDGVLAKFTVNGTRVWSTYYGGGSDDNGCGIDCSGNNLYMTGWTYSNTQVATPGAHQATCGGMADAFLVKFDTNGVRQWGTYYGGSNTDNSYSVVAFGNDVYFTGHSSSNNNISDSAAYQPSNSGNSDSYIAKFSNTGQKIWGTYYGGTSQENGEKICAAFGDLFICGSTSSTNAISSAGAYQQSFGGNWDAFIARFDTAGVRVWGSYFGGPGVEYGYAFYNDSSRMVIGGFTASTTGIATNSAFQNVFGGGSNDGFIASMYEPCQFINLSLTSSGDTGPCDGTASAEVTGGTAPYNYTWSNSDTTMQASGLCSGWYYVTVTDSNQCIFSDSIFVESTSGVLDPSVNNSFDIFPNPAGNEITVTLSSLANQNVNYFITDMLGQNVMVGRLSGSSNKISTLELPSGYYTLSLIVGSEMISKPVIICR